MKKTIKNPIEKNSSKTINAVKVGAGLAAAAAGYYFFASPKAKTHRQIAAKWASAMYADVIKEVQKLDDATPKAVMETVDRVVKTYQNMRSIDKEEVLRAAKEIKANASAVARSLKGNSRVVAKKIGKMAK